MIISTKQAAQKLGVSVSRVRQWAKDGHLKAVNTPKEEGKRVNWLFDSSVVNTFKKSDEVAQAATAVKATTQPSGPGEILRRLQSIEDKLDRLIALWA